MCRLMAYMGGPVLVADVVLWPDRSIIKQSYDARERKMDQSLPQHLAYGNLNGDGFGIGWFSPEDDRNDPTPCVFTSITPAWNNENLGRLSNKIVTPLVFAHVRAAYPGMPVSEQNCHPFQWGRYMWMHNGVVGGFMRMRRALLARLSDRAYDTVQSFHSDSAVSFAIFLHHLPDLTRPLPPYVLLRAMEATIATISECQEEAGITEISLLNFVVSDGTTLIATRFVSHEGEAPASLYYAEGSAFQRRTPARSSATNAAAGAGPAPHEATPMTNAHAARSSSVAGEGEYCMAYSEVGTRVVIVASEPITGSDSDWVAVPRNSALVVSREKGACLNVVRTPLARSGAHARQEEVSRCLEAVCAGAEASGPGRPPSAAAARWQHAPPRPQPRWESTVSASAPDDEAGGRTLSGASSGGSAGGFRAALVAADGPASAPAAPQLHDQHRLTGHQGAVVSLAVDQEGQRLFSGSTDCSIRVWRLEQCKLVRVLAGHHKPVHRLAIAGRRLFSTGGMRVRVWDLASLACLAVISPPEQGGAVCSLAVAPSGAFYVGCQDASVRSFACESLAALEPPAPPEAQSATASHPALSHAPNPAASAATPATASTSTPLANGSSAPAPARNGTTANGVNGSAPAGGGVPAGGTGSAGPSQPSWSQVAASSAADSHCSSVHALALCGDLLCSTGGDAMIRVWHADTLRLHRVLRGHRGSVLALCYGGGLLLSGGRDRVIRVWDMEALVCRRTLTGHRADVLALAALEQQPRGGGGRGDAWMQAFAGPAEVERRAGGGIGNPSAAVFASASLDGTVRLWSARTWACLRTLSTATAGPGSAPGPPMLAVALTDRHTITGSSDHTVRLWSSEDLLGRAASGLLAGPASSIADSSQSTGTVAARERGMEVTQDGSRAVKRQRVEPAGSSHGGGGAAGGAAGGLRARLERELERSLRELVAIRTVSLDPALHEDCFRGAKYVAQLLDSLGCEIKLARPVEDKNPVVIGRLGRCPEAATVTFYGHYDVQPAMEREWQTDPFLMTASDGYFYGRGTSDNKGPILAFIYAVKEMIEEGKAAGGGLPVNVAFVLEGEEENGSGGFREAVRNNLHWFEGTQLIVISNTLWVGEEVPCLTYGMRGMIALSIEVRGPERDLHSGNDGGVFAEPLADLTKVLAGLVDARGSIRVPGFYEAVRPGTLDAALERLEACEGEFSLAGYQQALGIPRLAKASCKKDLLMARWCEPTLSVVDVRVGDEDEGDTSYRFGPTRFSVIPHSAVGNVSIRFVPDQDANHLIESLRSFVEAEFAALGSGNRIAIKVKSVGDWWEADPQSKLFRLAERVLQREWGGAAPLLVREGGTMPVASALEKMLGAPALLLPLGQSSDNCHLANERIARINLMRGKNTIKGLLEEVAQL